MAVSKEDILESIANMTVTEVVGLIAAMEEKFGVTAAVAVAAAPAEVAGGDVASVEEQTEFAVVLTSFGENKVAVIKAVRSVTSLGLKEAKDLVESAPAPVKEAAGKDEAEDIKQQLEKAGATVELK